VRPSAGRAAAIPMYGCMLLTQIVASVPTAFHHALRALLGIAGVAVVALAILVVGSLPDHTGTHGVAALDGGVTIRRDEFAVPYIDADSEADGYFALGWVHATDRPWQLEMRRRIGQGRLAELLGPQAVPVDRFTRLLRFAELARSDLDAMQPADRRLVEAYAAGINARLERTHLLPPPFWLLWHRPEPWSAADALLWHKLMALDLARDWRSELLRARVATAVDADTFAELFPDVPAPSEARLSALRTALATLDLEAIASVAGPEPPGGVGSNGWVADPGRTRTRGPLLANDPHLGHELPGVWYLAGLSTPDFEVVGATLPGLPVFVTGRTSDVAWGMTNTGTDVQDLVIEALVGADRTLTPGGTAPLDVREEAIAVRGQPDETLTSRWSVNGPLVSDLGGEAGRLAGRDRAVALRWTALQPGDTTIAAGFALPHARDAAAIQRALVTFANPQQNVLFATRAGTIGLVSPGRVPVRRGGAGSLPRLGWETQGAWIGAVPHAGLPRALDPPTGWVANANNPPTEAAGRELAGQWDNPFRYRRIATLLAAGTHDLASFRALQLDTRSGLARELLPAMLTARASSAASRRWLARLRAWDGDARADRSEPTVFAAWYDALAEHLYADELGPLFAAYRGQRATFVRRALTERTSWCDDVGTPADEDCPTVLADALDQALAQLTVSLGPEGPAWRWGQQHPARFVHRFYGALGPLGAVAEASLPVGGDDTTVAAASFRVEASSPLFPSVHGVSYRQIVDLAAPARSRFVAAGGQVGHPLSRHYRDLLGRWHAGEDVAMAAPEHASAVERLWPR